MLRLCFFISALLALLPCRAAVLSLEQCVDSALARNPALAAAALSVERARILKATAFNPPMTEISLKQETTGGGGPENGVFFGQEFDFPTLYLARHKSLEARRALEADRFGALLAEVRGQVGSIFYSLLYSRELLRLNASLDSLYGEFCRVASVRLEQGDVGPLELMNARRLREKNEMERQAELSRYQSLLRDLQRVTGCVSLPEPADVPFGPIVSTVADFDFATSSRGRVAAGELAVAEREYAEARNEFLPGIRLGATVQALIRSFNPYNVERLPFAKGNFMGFEVGVTVPLFFGAQSARLKAADAQRRISLLDMQSAEVEASSEILKLRSLLSSDAARLEYYRSTALPQAREIRRVATVSYEFGDISYIEYISNMETAAAVFREYASCVDSYNQTLLRLESLSR